MPKHLANLDNNILRYANCWEDADLLLHALDISAKDRVLSIGSGGDNCFALLAKQPQLVVAVDINPVQLALIQLKKAAFQALGYIEFLEFLGFSTSCRRRELWEVVSMHLDQPTAAFWQLHLDMIEAGIIHQGKFEHYFATFRTKVLPLIHPETKVRQLLASKSDAEQAMFAKRQWNTWKWKSLFRVFFSKLVMGRLGRDPQFLSQVEGRVSSQILQRATVHLSKEECQENGFLHYILTGSFGEYLPYYAREEHFVNIKQQVSRLHVCQGYVHDAIREYGMFSKFNLSNIFEYMPSDLFESQVKMLKANSSPTSRIVYWNLLVDRDLAEVSNGFTSNEPFQPYIDKGFFYKRLILSKRL